MSNFFRFSDTINLASMDQKDLKLKILSYLLIPEENIKK